jgi:hypothetical protein
MKTSIIPCSQSVRAFVRTGQVTGNVPRTRVEAVIAWAVTPYEDDNGLVQVEVHAVGVRGVLHNVSSFIDYESGKDL